MSSVQTLERVAGQLSSKLSAIAATATGLILEEAPTYVRSIQLDGEELESIVVATCGVMVGSFGDPDILRAHRKEIERNAHHRSLAGVSLETMMNVIAIQRRCVIQAFEEMVGPGGERIVLMAERRLDRSYAELVGGIAEGYLDGMKERWQEQQTALEALVAISREINRSLDVADVAEAGITETLRVMGMDAGALWLKSAEESPLLLSHSFGFTAAEEAELALVRGSWIVEKAALSAGPIQTGPRPAQKLAVKGMSSVAAVPLLSQGRLFGVLGLASRVPRWLKQGELTFLLAVGDQVAVALARALQHRLEARTDYLTGLANRPEFDRALARAIAASQRHQRPLSLVVLDLDGLKAINDQHGHHAGDIAIRSVARALKRMVRATDTCARLGGDEFGVAMPDSTPAHAEELLQRVRFALVRTAENLPYRLDISFGARAWTQGMEVADLMKQADALLYQEKRKHRALRTGALR